MMKAKGKNIRLRASAEPSQTIRMLRTFAARRVSASCAIFCLMPFAFCLSCGPRAQQMRFELKGKVYEVDKRGGTVTVDHGDIPGYMNAMIMPFKLKDTWAFDVLKPGDRISAILVLEGERSWLEQIVVVQGEAEPSSATPASSTSEPKPGDEVSDFSLVNQDGKPIRFSGYRGRPLVLTFIYTRCPLPDYCPLMTNNFAEIDKAIGQDPDVYAKARLLSVSVDPDFDTPKVLRDYGAVFTEPTFSRWEFATGTRDEIKKVAGYFGLEYWPDRDQIIHSLRTAVIGPDGKLVKLYLGNEWKPSEILSQLRNHHKVE
jgi:protein SCO1